MESCEDCSRQSKKSIFSERCIEHDYCLICKKPRKELREAPWGKGRGIVCSPCEDDRCKKIIKEFQEKEVEDYEFTDSCHVKCPHCGYENDDTCELHETDDNFQCGDCMSYFNVEVEYLVTYTSSKKE